MRRHPQVLIAPPEGAATRAALARIGIDDANPALRCLLRVALAAAVAGALPSCKTADDGGLPKSASGIGARLARAGGSNVTGAARFQPFDGGITIIADTMGAPSGRSRIVIHANGNCSSPNAFSAGPPLTLPGSSAPAMVMITTDKDGLGTITTRLPGLAIDGPAGVNGKSVVVHAGTDGSLEAQPGVRNDRIACGVIETIRPLF